MKQKITFSMIMGIITTAIISFILITINVGFNHDFVRIWLKSWAIAYVIAVPCILIIAPQIEKLVKVIYKEK